LILTDAGFGDGLDDPRESGWIVMQPRAASAQQVDLDRNRAERQDTIGIARYRFPTGTPPLGTSARVRSPS
jgi:hypothetical protein